MSVALATTYHDARDRMYDQIQRNIPLLTQIFQGIAIQASIQAPQRSVTMLQDHGAMVERDPSLSQPTETYLGTIRRQAPLTATQYQTSHIVYFDSLLHWSDTYHDELIQIMTQHIPTYDMTIIGRTPRALHSHPHAQRETEQLINSLFQHLTGYAWDVMRSGRGFSRRAVDVILTQADDRQISTDVTWPLILLQHSDFALTCVQVEGTEFETGDRYSSEVQQLGGQQQWVNHLDTDPRRWAHRFNLARIHAEAMIPYTGENTRLERQ